MNQNPIIVFDFETIGLKHGYPYDELIHGPIQVAGLAIDPDRLEIYEDGKFETNMNPGGLENADARALSVNRTTIKEIEKYPDIQVAWGWFIEWINKFNFKKTQKGKPIPCGKNIRNFDMPIYYQCHKLYGKNFKKTHGFNNKYVLDLDDELYWWFENELHPERFSMDYLRENKLFGLKPNPDAHDAMIDVEETWMVMKKFLELKRNLQTKTTTIGAPFINWHQKI